METKGSSEPWPVLNEDRREVFYWQRVNLAVTQSSVVCLFNNTNLCWRGISYSVLCRYQNVLVFCFLTHNGTAFTSNLCVSSNRLGYLWLPTQSNCLLNPHCVIWEMVIMKDVCVHYYRCSFSSDLCWTERELSPRESWVRSKDVENQWYWALPNYKHKIT